MTLAHNLINKFDAWQQRHRWSAVTAAVVKKYGEDESGYKAALLTYYGFLSLFPLVLVLTTITSLVAKDYPAWQQDVVHNAGTYFPVLGDQLAQHVSTLHKSGLALAIGILFTLYGARGVADVFRRGVQQIWQVPEKERPKFPRTILSSLAIIIVGGLGFIVAAAFTGLAAAAGHGLGFRLFSVAVNLFLLFWLFTFLLNACLPRRVPTKDVRSGALAAAIGLVILQVLGGYVLKNELRHLDALYSYFAISLGLLFWIYLQAQLLYYSATLAAVRAQRLWPRKLSDK